MEAVSMIVLLLLNQTLLYEANDSIAVTNESTINGFLVDTVLFEQENNTILVLSDTVVSSSCSRANVSFTNGSYDELEVVTNNTSLVFTRSDCDDCLEEVSGICELEQEMTTCDFALFVDVDDKIVVGDTIRFTPYLEPSLDDFSLEYSWKDLFNNTLRGPTITNNLNPKQYSPQTFNDRAFDVVKLEVIANNSCFRVRDEQYIVVHNPDFIEEEAVQEEDQDPDICDTNVTISAETFFSAGDTVRFTPQTNVAQNNFTISYWFENLRGEIVREVQVTNNLNTKQFTPATNLLPDYSNVFVLGMELENSCVEVFANHTVVVVNENFTSFAQEDATQEEAFQDSRNALELLVPEELYEQFSVSTTIYNEGLLDEEFFLSVYVYRHSINFSDRAPELVIVPPQQEQEFVHEFALEPGEYSLKAQLWPPGRRTPIEERTTIVVQEDQVHNETFVNTTTVVNETVVVLPPRLEQEVQTPTGFVAFTNDTSFREYVDVSLLVAILVAVLLWLLAFVMRRRSAENEEKIL